jgi:ribosomal protein L11 methyltransferase
VLKVTVPDLFKNDAYNLLPSRNIFELNTGLAHAREILGGKMNDTWHALSLNLPENFLGEALALLENLGSNGCTEEKSKDAGFVNLTAYFSGDLYEKTALFEKVLESFKVVPGLSNLRLEINTSMTTDWNREWRQWFHPFKLVPGITVRPSWEPYVPTGGESVIVLDPGMAFGTGLHPTTKLCARAIYDAKESGKESSLLDVGSGSGLLAIVGRKLGIKTIDAVEIDDEAIRVARENIDINDAGSIKIYKNLGEISTQYDIVAANILLITLIQLEDELIAKTKTGGRLILSGITHDQEEDIKQAFQTGLALHNLSRMDEWSCITFERQS